MNEAPAVVVDRIAESYDETPYPSLAVPETHPGRLAAARFGLHAPQGARVLGSEAIQNGLALEVAEREAEHDLDFRTHFERRTRLHGEAVYRSEFVK